MPEMVRYKSHEFGSSCVRGGHISGADTRRVFSFRSGCGVGMYPFRIGYGFHAPRNTSTGMNVHF